MTTKPDLLARARLLLAGELQPSTPRPAATVALVRDGATGLEVYLLRRVRGMSFAAGMHVFPGGSVDPADQPDAAAPGSLLGWAGPGPGWWAQRFGTAEVTAAALVSAAVRETFEEAGVLLAGPSADRLVDDVSGDDWEAERVALEAGQQSLSQLLLRRGLLLRADLLAPVAHWITPEIEPKRFDTRFFVAALPERQICREVGTEADLRLWIRPQDALASGLRIMHPTAAVLADLAEHPNVASALHAEREITTVQPRFEVDGDQLKFIR
ncbi:MAG TPA: NUDIX hydrolase [Kineosporiaceae bacterium]|nr:NUDIX hydrolase [Kineosporiaceae bacterium]